MRDWSDEDQATIDMLCIYRNLSKAKLFRYSGDGMPDPRLGASFDECNAWIHKNKTTDVELGRQLGLRPAKLTILKGRGMPVPQDGASLNTIRKWLEKHWRDNFSTYGQEKLLGLCKKTIRALVDKGMPDPSDGVTPEVCHAWMEKTFDTWSPIWQLAKLSGKSYDALLRRINKKGMPDPREGFPVQECLDWINSSMSFTEMAERLGVAMGTVVNWTRLGMPNPREGAKERDCINWVVMHHQPLGLKIKRNSLLWKMMVKHEEEIDSRRTAQLNEILCPSGA